MKLNIVLVEPEIPQNTGNISRTCAAIGATLHLVKPLGFSIEDRYLRRAGLDYWQHLSLKVHESFEAFRETESPEAESWYLSTRGRRSYEEIQASDTVYLVFGKETKGLPLPLIEANSERCFRIPMREGIRSLNLSNAVAIVAYDMLRKTGFEGMRMSGSLARKVEQ